MSAFWILALASSALAVPNAGHGHLHRHHRLSSAGASGSGSGLAHYALANDTGIWGPTGTAASTGFPIASGYTPSSKVEVATSAESVSTTCTRSTTYVTKTHQVTVTVQPSSAVNASSSSSSSSDEATSSDLEKRANGKWHRSTTSTSSTSGKRGCAYNDASLCGAFDSSSQITWGYNWGSYSSGLSSNYDYVPLLWGTSTAFTSVWDAAVKSSNATHLMSFNEPDLSTQSNLSPSAAASAFKTHLQPYASTHKLGAPSVTNGAGSMGLDWLDAFLQACSDCTIDFVSIHWYDSFANTDYFKQHVSNASTVAGGLPVWVTEFGTTDGSDEEISGFLEEVMPWMDGESMVERYSYFMASDGILCDGEGLSAVGETFASFTS